MSRPVPPRIRAQLADVGLDPTGPTDTYHHDAQTSVDNGRLLIEVNRLRAEKAALADDVRYWNQRHDLYKALWYSLPRRLRRYFFARYDRANPLGIERLT